MTNRHDPIRGAEPTDAIASRVDPRALEINTVLKNTYLLLAATLGFSAVCGLITARFGLPFFGRTANGLVFLAGFFGLLFLIRRTQDSALGLVFVFALTGFMGSFMGPVIDMYLKTADGAMTVASAFGTTAVAFVGLSLYAISSRKSFHALTGWLVTGIPIAFVIGLIGFFFNMPTMSIVASVLFAPLMVGLILWETSRIVNGGERNYISATTTLFISIYNLFTSLLHIFGLFND